MWPACIGWKAFLKLPTNHGFSFFGAEDEINEILGKKLAGIGKGKAMKVRSQCFPLLLLSPLRFALCRRRCGIAQVGVHSLRNRNYQVVLTLAILSPSTFPPKTTLLLRRDG